MHFRTQTITRYYYDVAARNDDALQIQPKTSVARPSAFLTLAPALCAVHCLATPVLAAAAPVLGGHPVIEWSAFGLSLLAAAFTFRHLHPYGGRVAPAAAAVGFLLWLLALTLVHRGAAHTPMLVAGSLTVAGAMLVALRAHAKVSACGCHVCATESAEIAPGERAAMG